MRNMYNDYSTLFRVHAKQFLTLIHSLSYSKTSFPSAFYLKKYHSIRVFSLAKKASENYFGSGSDGHITVSLAAIYHDVGRFYQISKYDTFDDRKSQNHGALSVAVLKQKNFLKDIPRELRTSILATIITHNKHRIPDHYTGPLRSTSHMLRDCDKIDILSVVTKYFNQFYRTSDYHSFNLAPSINPKVLNDLEQCRPVQYAKIVSLNDYLLFLCGWVFDLGFDFSRRVFVERAYVDRLLDLIVWPEGMGNLKADLGLLLSRHLQS